MAELVWALPSPLLGKKDGYLPLPSQATFNRWFKKSQFLPRQQAETNPAWRQWIPYVTLRRADKVYMLKRHTGGGEVRLHERLTVGLGGHVNPLDETHKEGPILGALWRELEEEAHLLPGCGALHPSGLIKLSDNDVSRVHVGVHFLLTLPAGARVRLSEDGGREGRWVTPRQLNWRDERLETWSNTALKAMGWE